MACFVLLFVVDSATVASKARTAAAATAQVSVTCSTQCTTAVHPRCIACCLLGEVPHLGHLGAMRMQARWTLKLHAQAAPEQLLGLTGRRGEVLGMVYVCPQLWAARLT